MRYLDSWVWLEYVFDGSASAEASSALQEAHTEGGVTSTIALTEIDYILRREIGDETADFVTSSIEDRNSIRTVPVSDEIALRASSLRTKYYRRREREVSYADAIHLATAIVCDCEILYTGDSDFEEIDEVETVVYS